MTDDAIKTQNRMLAELCHDMKMPPDARGDALIYALRQGRRFSGNCVQADRRG